MVTEVYGSQWGEFGKSCFCSVTLLPPCPQFSFCFGLFFLSCFAFSSSMWLMVAGLTCDNYFLRCLEALSSKEGELQHCVPFCTSLAQHLFEIFTYMHHFCLQSDGKRLLSLFFSCLLHFPSTTPSCADPLGSCLYGSWPNSQFFCYLCWTSTTCSSR